MKRKTHLLLIIPLLISTSIFAQSDSLGFYYGELGDYHVIRDSSHLKKYLASLPPKFDITEQDWEMLNESLIKKKLRPIVKKISKYESVHSEGISYGGTKSQLYIQFELLIKTATELELLQLTNHINPIVRCYAFWGLNMKNYSNINSIIQKHKNDNERIWFFYGCTMAEMEVREFMDGISKDNIESYVYNRN